jgi:hypothetical protein
MSQFKSSNPLRLSVCTLSHALLAQSTPETTQVKTPIFDAATIMFPIYLAALGIVYVLNSFLNIFMGYFEEYQHLRGIMCSVFVSL